MLNWTQEQLALFAGISRSTVRDFECHRHELHRAAEALLVRTFEDAGLHLIFDRQNQAYGYGRIGRTQPEDEDDPGCFE